MSSGFSYSGDPNNSDKDKVRFLLGDTDADRPLLRDKEIKYLLDEENTVLRAAVAGALAIAAKFSRRSDESVGDVSKSYSQRAEMFRKLAGELRRRNSEKNVAPYAGGISENDKRLNSDDEDLVKPSFTRELHDNPRVVNIPDDFDEFGNP